jgi:hypothetical protein
MITLGVVVPCYNEAPVLLETTRRLPSLATSGPKAAGALWALQRQRQG